MISEEKRRYNKAYHEAHKETIKENGRRWWANNKEVARANSRARRIKYPDEFKSQDRKKRYGISIVEYRDLLLKQGSKCAICDRGLREGNVKTQGLNSAHLDHNHKTGKNRMFLCHHCNHGLGQFQDSSELLYRAAKYLEFHNNELPSSPD